jgi:hydrogenase 3 maturation protease
MSDQVILTVGNSMMGDDAAGPLLSGLLRSSPAAGWQVVDGGSAPENVLHRIRAVGPERVVVVDATEMELAPGEVRLVDDRFIAEQFIFTTHDLPLSFLIAALRESVGQVYLLGIQPALVAFGYPVSAAVEQAVANIHERLQRGEPIETWPYLETIPSAADHNVYREESNHG